MAKRKPRGGVRIPITEAKKNKIIASYEKLQNCAAVAEKFGVAPNTVRKFVQGSGKANKKAAAPSSSSDNLIDVSDVSYITSVSQGRVEMAYAFIKDLPRGKAIDADSLKKRFQISDNTVDKIKKKFRTENLHCYTKVIHKVTEEPILIFGNQKTITRITGGA
jgi:transposase